MVSRSGSYWQELTVVRIVQKNFFLFQVTEKEIFNGIINAKQLDKNALYFIREIDGIELGLETNNKLARRFIDTDSNGKIDESAQTLLNDLKYNKIPSKIPVDNIFKFNVIAIFCLILI